MNVQVLAVEEKQRAPSTATFKYLGIEYRSSDERGRGIQGDHSASHHRSLLPNHILCGTMFQPLTKDHGDDNHLAVTSADSRGSQDLGRRPEMASAGFAMDRFVPNKKDSAK